ncbi:hypothetical protein LEADMM271B_13340 [Leclercia adecarboxylata]
MEALSRDTLEQNMAHAVGRSATFTIWPDNEAPAHAPAMPFSPLNPAIPAPLTTIAPSPVFAHPRSPFMPPADLMGRAFW